MNDSISNRLKVQFESTVMTAAFVWEDNPKVCPFETAPGPVSILTHD